MSEFHTSSFRGAAAGLFTKAQIEDLMRVEFERAQRYEYPAVCFVISVDRLDGLQDLYGAESRGEILASVVEVLTSRTRASDFFGCMHEDRIVALLSHLDMGAAEALAGRVLRGCRELEFHSDGRRLRVTVSIGLAHTGERPPEGFDELRDIAETGLEVAHGAGGDRVVARAGLQAELEDLQTELEEATLTLQVEQEALVEETEDIRERKEALVITQIEEIFNSGLEDSPEAQRMRAEMMALARAQAEGDRERVIAEKVREHTGTIELLERRISKLTAALGATEEELVRVARLKDVDLGLSSIYRTVQGVSNTDTHADRKLDMMKDIFEANIRIQDSFNSEGDLAEK